MALKDLTVSNGLLIGLISLLLILIVFSAFFSAAETAYSSVSKSKIEIKAKEGKRSALLIKKHHKSFGWTLATILICNNLVNISASALITYLFTQLMGSSGTVAIVSTFVMTPIIVIFGEIAPKLLAKKYAYGYLAKISYIMETFNILLYPITYPMSKIDLQSSVTNSEVELKDLISLAKSEGVLDRNEATLASKALDLDSKTVLKVMTKKKKIISIDSKATVGQALKLFKKHGFSRLPVKNENGFMGLIILKDLFFANSRSKITKYIVDINMVSQHILVSKAMETMRTLKSHLVLVTNKQESNKVVGLLTIEDIIEELVGEIYDEHDIDLSIRQIAHFKWSVVGSEKIKVFEETIGVKLENEDGMETIKQWIQSRINRKISSGLKYSYKNKLSFKIVSNRNGEDTLIEVIKK